MNISTRLMGDDCRPFCLLTSLDMAWLEKVRGALSAQGLAEDSRLLGYFREYESDHEHYDCVRAMYRFVVQVRF